MHIHVIHENAAWLEPPAQARACDHLPWRDWLLDRGVIALGVRQLHRPGARAQYLDIADYEATGDGLPLLQQYVRAPVPLITRAEFIGGRFLYAVEVDTSEGFELCPADQCVVGDAFCPAGPDAADAPPAKFTIIDAIAAGPKPRYAAFRAP